MPVQYEGVRQEHVAVRTAAGLFDVSHMGEIETRGPRAAEFLRHLLDQRHREGRPGRRAVLAPVPRGRRRARRPVHLPARAGNGEEQRFLTVVNASNAESDFDWFRRQADGWEGVEVIDRSAEYAMLALQGPARGRALRGCSRRAGPGALPPCRGRRSRVCRPSCAARATRARTAWSCWSSRSGATAVWDALLERGARPAGLGARDTLRLEVCYPLYGNDLTHRRARRSRRG